MRALWKCFHIALIKYIVSKMVRASVLDATEAHWAKETAPFKDVGCRKYDKSYNSL